MGELNNDIASAINRLFFDGARSLPPTMSWHIAGEGLLNIVNVDTTGDDTKLHVIHTKELRPSGEGKYEHFLISNKRGLLASAESNRGVDFKGYPSCKLVHDRGDPCGARFSPSAKDQSMHSPASTTSVATLLNLLNSVPLAGEPKSDANSLELLRRWALGAETPFLCSSHPYLRGYLPSEVAGKLRIGDVATDAAEKVIDLVQPGAIELFRGARYLALAIRMFDEAIDHGSDPAHAMEVSELHRRISLASEKLKTKIQSATAADPKIQNTMLYFDKHLEYFAHKEAQFLDRAESAPDASELGPREKARIQKTIENALPKVQQVDSNTLSTLSLVNRPAPRGSDAPQIQDPEFLQRVAQSALNKGQNVFLITWNDGAYPKGLVIQDRDQCEYSIVMLPAGRTVVTAPELPPNVSVSCEPYERAAGINGLGNVLLLNLSKGFEVFARLSSFDIDMLKDGPRPPSI